jgi:hypothetical protein
VWKVSCIFQCLGSSSRYVVSDIFWVMGKGPYLFGASLVDSYGSGRFVRSSHTRSSTLKGLKFVSLMRRFCAALMASWASRRCLCISLSRSSRFGRCVVLRGCWMIGVYPRMSSKGVFFVVLLIQAFFVYCTIGSHFAQSRSCLPVSMRSPCSICWLVRSLCPSV